MPEQNPTDDEQNRQDCDHRHRKSDLVPNQINQHGVAVLHRQNPLDEIPQRPPAKQRQHKCPQRHLKHPLGQHKNLERKRRRQNPRNENAQKRVALHPALHSVRSAMPVKICLAAFLRQQVNPDAAGQRPERRHRAVVRHPRRPLARQFHHQGVSDKRQREHRRIEKRGYKKPCAAHCGNQRRQPVRHFQWIHFAVSLQSAPIVTEFFAPSGQPGSIA